MLNLSRAVGQVVRIGDDVAVQVEKISGNCVRLGFTAPREVAIYRDEVYRQRIAAGSANQDRPGHRRVSPCPHPARVEARHVLGRRPIAPVHVHRHVAGTRGHAGR